MSEPAIHSHLRQWIDEGAQVLADFVGDAPIRVGLILGSGLNAYADTLEDVRVLPYASVPHLRTSTAAGHVGRFVVGRVAGSDCWVLVMQGRIHAYEGACAQEVAYPVWLMAKAGIKVLVTTNAAGAINPAFAVGSFVAMTDHVNLMGHNPVTGIEPSLMAERYVPMLDAYDPALREQLLAVARDQGIDVNTGVHLGVLGPSFETAAEIRMFGAWGCDVVSMCTVEECIAARHVGVKVVGLSLVSNMACGVEGTNPQIDDILDVADVAHGSFKRLMDAYLPTL